MNYISGCKFTGLKHFQKEDGGWQLKLTDPRLTSDVVHKVLGMLRQNPPSTFMQVKKVIGKWYMAKHHKAIKKILNVSTDDTHYNDLKFMEQEIEKHNSLIDAIYLQVAREMEQKSSVQN